MVRLNKWSAREHLEYDICMYIRTWYIILDVDFTPSSASDWPPFVVIVVFIIHIVCTYVRAPNKQSFREYCIHLAMAARRLQKAKHYYYYYYYYYINNNNNGDKRVGIGIWKRKDIAVITVRVLYCRGDAAVHEMTIPCVIHFLFVGHKRRLSIQEKTSDFNL
jgi:hypothetical protein